MPSLISNGIDAHFVLEELELSELYPLIKSLDSVKKEKMEQKRFWTFFQILPQIDSKKIKSPKDLLLFPWENIDKEEEEKILRRKKV